MKKLATWSALSFFLIVFATACGGSNPSDAGSGAGSGTGSEPVVLNAGEAIREEFPPSLPCDPTSTTGVINGSVKDPFLDFVIFGAGVTLTREGTPPQRTSTDEQGTYRFCNLEPGNYQLSAYGLGFDSTNFSTALNVEVTAGLFTTVDLELSLGFQGVPTNIGAVQGSVIDISTGNALSGVDVKALINTTTGESVDTITDSNGEFFLSLNISTYTIVFSKEGFISKPKFSVTINSDKVTRLIEDPVTLFPDNG